MSLVEKFNQLSRIPGIHEATQALSEEAEVNSSFLNQAEQRFGEDINPAYTTTDPRII